MWYLWRPCVGLPGAVPPLAQWSQMLDGTLSLADVAEMHAVLDELDAQRAAQMNSGG